MAAKLTSWSLHPIRLPYRRSVRWASAASSDATFMLLRVRADDGTEGVGEMYVNPRWFGATLRTLTVVLEELFFPLLDGIDPLDPSLFARRARTIPEHMSAKALVDNALWDLAAAVSGKPFWHAAGEEHPAVSWTLTRQTPTLMAAEAAEMVAQHGFRTIKLKGGQGVDVDLDAVRLLRAAVGSGVTIYIDCNREYDTTVTPEYLRTMAAEGVVAIEDPYPVEPNAVFERIQSASPIPIVLDIPCAAMREARLFCDRGARSISLKPGRVGLSEAAAMADFTGEHDCSVFVGTAAEGHIGSLSALAAARLLTRPEKWLPAEGAFFLMLGDRVTTDPLTVVDGRVRLPDVGGLAQLVDWERVERLHP